MSNIPNQRLNVFISSAMKEESGTNWLKIRKKVKDKLSTCEYINPFIIEEHASEMKSIDYFKFMVRQSDIVVLLIKEELRAGVQAEISVIYEEKKPCLIYFYNGQEGDLLTNAFKENLINVDFATFKEISNFENIEEEIYNDLLENIITQYKFNHFKKVYNIEEKNISTESTFKEAINDYAMGKNILDIFSSCIGYILNEDGYNYLTINNSTEKSFNHDFGCKLLRWISTGNYFLEPSDINKFLNDTNYIHSDKVWYRYRWDSINYYEKGNIEKALEYQMKALNDAKSNNVNKWIINNILIDCRNLEVELGNFKNKYQDELANQDTFVQFPIIDRMKADIYNNIAKERFDVLTSSIHTIRLGSNISSIMENVENYIFISALYGSLTHLDLARDIIGNIYFEYAQIHNDDGMYYQSLKYWILSNDYSKVEKFLMQYWDKVYLQLYAKSKEIWEIIRRDNIKPRVKCVVIKFLGLYFDDETYKLVEDCIVQLENKICSNSSELYIETLIENSYRLSQEVLVDIICKLLEKNKLFMGSKISRLILKLNIDNVGEEKIVKLENELCKKLDFIIHNNGNIQIVAHLYNQNSNVFKNLSKISQPYLKNIEKEFYDINTRNNDDYYNLIEELISLAQEQYKINNNKGVYHGFSLRPLKTLCNVIEDNFDIKYEKLIASKLILLCKDILDSYAPLSMKEESLECLIIIFNEFEKKNLNYNWRKQFEFIENFSINYDNLMGPDYVSALAVDLRKILFKVLLGFNTTNEIFYKYLSFNSMDVYERRVLSECINKYIIIKKNMKQDIDNSFVMIIYSLSNDEDEIVRRNVVESLGELITDNIPFSIKQKMDELMLDSSLYVRFSFINLIKENKINNIEYVNEILENYCNDNNYLLRKEAKKLKDKLEA